MIMLSDPTLRKFRDGAVRGLVTTDFADSRSLPRAVVAINYDLPTNIETYIHLAGAADRNEFYKAHRDAGAPVVTCTVPQRVVINLVAADNMHHLRNIEQHYNTQMEAMPMTVMDIIRACFATPRERVAASRIHRAWRDACYNPAYAHARTRLLRQFTSGSEGECHGEDEGEGKGDGEGEGRGETEGESK